MFLFPFGQGLRRRARPGAIPVTVGFCFIAAATVSPEAAHATARYEFRGLGDLPGGAHSSGALAVSSDGSVVVGYARTGSGEEAFRWTASGGMQALGDLPGRARQSRALSVSGDGSIVVGYSGLSVTPGASSDGEAFIWTAGTGMVGFGTLERSSAAGVSADGSLIVGSAVLSDHNQQAYRRTPTAGLVGLDFLDPDVPISVASGVSPDGSVVVGTSHRGAVRWTHGGRPVLLGDLPGASFSEAYAASDAGGVIVGRVTTQLGPEAFRWTEEEGMRRLGPSAVGQPDAAFDVSADGTRVVGETLGQRGEGAAFLWTRDRGLLGLQHLLVHELGLAEQLDGWRLAGAFAISDDGTTVVGVGVNPSGDYEAWRAVIPEPTGAPLTASGGLLLFPRRRHRRHRA